MAKAPKVQVMAWWFVICDHPDCAEAAVSENMGSQREASVFATEHRAMHRREDG